MKSMLLLLILALLPAALLASQPPKELQQYGRLPEGVRPLHYAVELQPLPEGNQTIRGSVDISLAALKPLEDIYIHSLNQTIHSVSLEPQVQVLSATLLPSLEVLHIKLASKLELNTEYKLSIQYEGTMKASREYGLYLTYLIDGNGKNVTGASSQFEPTKARLAFPCFDEPSLKATFDITVIRKEHMTALSNMPLKTSTPLENGWVRDEFHTTPVMSPYIVAMAVGDYSRNANGPYAVWGDSVQIKNSDHALSVLPVILQKLGSLLQIEYPLPKMDMIAVEPFASGAMENWGLVTFRPQYLMWNPEKQDTMDKNMVTVVVGHELAHMWFGNLVTTAWWDTIFLNEAFAAFFEHLALSLVDPQINPDERMVHGTVLPQLRNPGDALEIPVVKEVKNSLDAKEIFSPIVYNKGSALLRMMLHHIGPQNFIDAIRHYLAANSYSNSVPAKLYASLEATCAPADLAAMMDTWLYQPGHPVVTITRDYQAGTAKISQRPEGNAKKPFHIPISYTDSQQQDYRPLTKLVLKTESAVVGDMPGEDDWVLANLHLGGFYHVEYDDRNLALLLAQMEELPEVIPTINRAHLRDLKMLRREDVKSLGLYLNSTQSMKDEKSYVVWAAFLKSVRLMEMVVQKDDQLRKGLRAYLKELVTPLYREIVSWAAPLVEDVESNELLAETITTLACTLDVDQCRETALEYYEEMRTSDNLRSVPVHYWYISGCLGLKNATKEDKENFMSYKIGRAAIHCSKKYSKDEILPRPGLRAFVGVRNKEGRQESTLTSLVRERESFHSNGKNDKKKPQISISATNLRQALANFLKSRQTLPAEIRQPSCGYVDTVTPMQQLIRMAC